MSTYRIRKYLAEVAVVRAKGSTPEYKDELRRTAMKLPDAEAIRIFNGHLDKVQNKDLRLRLNQLYN